MMILKNIPFSFPDKGSREIDYIKGVYKKRIQSEIDSYISEDELEVEDVIKVQDILLTDSFSN